MSETVLHAIECDCQECLDKWINAGYEIKMKWISVKESPLPKEGKHLAINKEGEQAVIWYDYKRSFLIRGSWYGGCEYGCGGDDFFENTTHWMPLPEPPKD